MVVSAHYKSLLLLLLLYDLYWVCTEWIRTKAIHSLSGTSFVELAVSEGN